VSIVKQLSSQKGDRTAQSNKNVVEQCKQNPELLDEISEGLKGDDPGMLGDCAEVMTEVAKKFPELVTPFADLMPPLLDHEKTMVRWEAMHTLALIANRCEDIIEELFSTIRDIMKNDESTIVRDYAVDAIATYASISAVTAEKAYPILVDAFDLWEGRQAKQALNGLVNVLKHTDTHNKEISKIAESYLDHKKGVVRKVAEKIIKKTKV
jgi:hypothetical protein